MNNQGITKTHWIGHPKKQTKEPLRKRLLTISEACSYLGMSKPTFRTLYWNGLIPIIKTKEGRNDKIRIDIFDLDKWIEQHKTRYTY